MLTALCKQAMACLVAACLLVACSGSHSGGGVTVNFCGVKISLGGSISVLLKRGNIADLPILLTASASQILPSWTYYQVGPSCSEGGSVVFKPQTGVSGFTVIARDALKRPTVVQFSYSRVAPAEIIVDVGKVSHVIDVPLKK